MLVWLTNWQIEEDRQLITVGDTGDWTLYPADRDTSGSWARRRTTHEHHATDRSTGSFRYAASYTSARHVPEAESLYGYVATLT